MVVSASMYSGLYAGAYDEQEEGHPRLPYDVLYSVFSYVDFDTLKMLSSLSSVCRKCTAHRLWRSFTISVDKGLTGGIAIHGASHLLRMVKLIRDEVRAEHIQVLRIRIYAPIDNAAGDWGLKGRINSLYDAIQGLSALYCLQLDTVVHREEFAHGLMGRSFAPGLEMCIFNVSSLPVEGLDDIFEGMRGLRSLRWTNDHYKRRTIQEVQPLAKPLPSLNELVVYGAQYAALMRGSPVSHLTVHSLNPSHSSMLLAHIQASTSPLVHLQLDFGLTQVVKPLPVFRDLLQHLSSLLYLEIMVDPWPDGSNEGVQCLAYLATLPKVEEFVWKGASCYWQKHICSVANTSGFTNLQHGTFLYRVDNRSLVREDGLAVLKDLYLCS